MGAPFFAMFLIALSIVPIQGGYDLTSEFAEEISSYGWTKTQAIITDKGSYQKYRRRNSRIIDIKHYIIYRYTTMSDTMKGEVEYINNNSPDDIISGAAKGDIITVYYNPREPAVSRYVIGVNWYTASLVLMLNYLSSFLLYFTYEIWRIDSTSESEYREHAHPYRILSFIAGALTLLYVMIAMIF